MIGIAGRRTGALSLKYVFVTIMGVIVVAAIGAIFVQNPVKFLSSQQGKDIEKNTPTVESPSTGQGSAGAGSGGKPGSGSGGGGSGIINSMSIYMSTQPSGGSTLKPDDTLSTDIDVTIHRSDPSVVTGMDMKLVMQLNGENKTIAEDSCTDARVTSGEDVVEEAGACNFSLSVPVQSSGIDTSLSGLFTSRQTSPVPVKVWAVASSTDMSGGPATSPGVKLDLKPYRESPISVTGPAKDGYLRGEKISMTIEVSRVDNYGKVEVFVRAKPGSPWVTGPKKRCGGSADKASSSDLCRINFDVTLRDDFKKLFESYGVENKSNVQIQGVAYRYSQCSAGSCNRLEPASGSWSTITVKESWGDPSLAFDKIPSEVEAVGGSHEYQLTASNLRGVDGQVTVKMSAKSQDGSPATEIASSTCGKEKTTCTASNTDFTLQPNEHFANVDQEDDGDNPQEAIIVGELFGPAGSVLTSVEKQVEEKEE